MSDLVAAVLWPAIIDFAYHGFDNHPCDRRGCCR